MALLQTASDIYQQAIAPAPEPKIPLGIIIATLGLLSMILGGVISQWIWMRSKMAEHDVRIAEMEVKISKKDKEFTEERQQNSLNAQMASREVTSTFARVFDKLDSMKDEIKSDIQGILINCAAEENHVKTLIVNELKDRKII
jgi:uncharacterized protein YdcH (DUF465 family)